jgi:hypothetical protein
MSVKFSFLENMNTDKGDLYSLRVDEWKNIVLV